MFNLFRSSIRISDRAMAQGLLARALRRGGGGGCRAVMQTTRRAISSSARRQSMLLSRLQSELDEILEQQRIRRSAPDWLPFLPGRSYFVPDSPHLSNNAALPLLDSESPKSLLDSKSPKSLAKKSRRKGASSKTRSTEDAEEAQVLCHIVVVDS